MAACLAAEWTCRFSQSTIHSVSAASTEEAMSWVDSMIERPLSANCLRRRFISSRPATSRNAVGSSRIISGVSRASARANITFGARRRLACLTAYRHMFPCRRLPAPPLQPLCPWGRGGPNYPVYGWRPISTVSRTVKAPPGAVCEYHGEPSGKLLLTEAAQSRTPYAHCAGSWRLCSRECATVWIFRFRWRLSMPLGFRSHPKVDVMQNSAASVSDSEVFCFRDSVHQLKYRSLRRFRSTYMITGTPITGVMALTGITAPLLSDGHTDIIWHIIPRSAPHSAQ